MTTLYVLLPLAFIALALLGWALIRMAADNDRRHDQTRRLRPYDREREERL